MPQAILIGGNAERFMDDVRDFRTYLEREAGIGPKRIRTFPTAYAADGMLEYRLESAATEHTKTPLLILYCGHGGESGWALDDVRTFEYRRLARILRPGIRPIVIVNDCCHAMAAAKHFEEQGVSWKRLSFIAASENGETTSGILVRLALDNWRQRRAVRFGPELRWGERHDHLFFPVDQKKDVKG